MKTKIKLLSIALMLSSIVIANFIVLGLRDNESGKQCADAQLFSARPDTHARTQLLSGEDRDKAVKMALLDETVARLSNFLQTLNYKPQTSDNVAVRVTWSNESGQHDVTGVSLAFKNNEDKAIIVYVKKEEESQTMAFTFHKSYRGTTATLYRVDQKGAVSKWARWRDCIACGLCAGCAILIAANCVAMSDGCAPCVVACVFAEAHGVEMTLHCSEHCLACFEKVGIS